MLVVFGSINLDLTYHVKKLPKDGETVIANGYTIGPGGKGANQALAAARMGVKTALVAKTGDDANSVRVLNNLKRNEVMTSGVAKSETLPTGTATIIVDEKGNNQIIYVPGANNEISAEQLPSDILHNKNVLLAQMETPLEETVVALKKAKDSGARTILNLAPAQKIPSIVMQLAHYFIVNEVEADYLIKTLKLDPGKNITDKARALSQIGKTTVIITLAEKGCVAVTPEDNIIAIEPPKIDKVVDSTGAGDCFAGTFAACLHEGMDLKSAIKTAITAATLSCLKPGAQNSYPYKDDIRELMKK
ncbi:MAG: ribokinase [Pseudomonadota bacterium]